MLSLHCRNQNTLFRFICFAEDLFTLTSNKFRIVHKLDWNSQLDSRDWSMYSNILRAQIQFIIFLPLKTQEPFLGHVVHLSILGITLNVNL